MTIEYAMKSPSRKGNVVLGHIIPGEIATFSDFTGGERQVVSVYCRGDDMGGEVYAFPDAGSIQAGNFRVLPADAYEDQEPEAIIGYGGSYERDVTMESRHIGHLVFTHMPSNAS